jgi:hypothetical protein
MTLSDSDSLKVLDDKLKWNNFKEFFYFLLYAEEYELEEEIKRYDGTEVKATGMEEGTFHLLFEKSTTKTTYETQGVI